MTQYKRERDARQYKIDQLLYNILPLKRTRETDGKDSSDSYSSSDDDKEMSEEEKMAYRNIHADDDEITSGYSTISSTETDFVPRRAP